MVQSSWDNAPVEYSDPYWQGLARKYATQYGVPEELVLGILLRGEKTNADQVGSKGERGPFQFMPDTRQSFIDKHNIDPWVSPDANAEAAVIHLKESLDKYKDRPEPERMWLAAAEYNGGPDFAKKPAAVEYANRVTSAQPAERIVPDMPGMTGRPDLRARMDEIRARSARQPGRTLTPQESSNAFSAYAAYARGEMNEAQRKEYEEGVSNGTFPLPRGVSELKFGIAAEKAPAKEPPAASESALRRYIGGVRNDPMVSDRFTEEERIDFEREVARGNIRVPEGFRLTQTTMPGSFDSFMERFSGKARATAETQTLPSYIQMPEIAAADTLRGIMLSGKAEEIKNVITSTSPDVTVRQDAKGNYIFKSAMDGKEYAIRPGAEWSDLLRVAPAVGVGLATAPAAAAAMPAGAGAIALGAATGAAGQLGIEALRTATGMLGEEQTLGGALGRTAIATGLGAAIPGAGAVLRAARPMATAARGAPAVMPEPMPAALQAVPEAPPMAPPPAQAARAPVVKPTQQPPVVPRFKAGPTASPVPEVEPPAGEFVTVAPGQFRYVGPISGTAREIPMPPPAPVAAAVPDNEFVMVRPGEFRRVGPMPEEAVEVPSRIAPQEFEMVAPGEFRRVAPAPAAAMSPEEVAYAGRRAAQEAREGFAMGRPGEFRRTTPTPPTAVAIDEVRAAVRQPPEPPSEWLASVRAAAIAAPDQPSVANKQFWADMRAAATEPPKFVEDAVERAVAKADAPLVVDEILPAPTAISHQGLDATSDDLRRLLARASGAGALGRGSKKAQVELAQALNIDQASVEAAARLGVLEHMPPDYFSTETALRQLFQAVRSVRGKAGAAVKDAAQSIIRGVESYYGKLGAKADIKAFSDDVRSGMTSQREKLVKVEDDLWNELRSSIPGGTPIKPTATLGLIKDRLSSRNLSSETLKPAEKQIIRTLSGKKITYDILNDIRKNIGTKTVGSVWADSDEALNKLYYSKILEDQGALAEKLGAADVFDAARAATRARKALEDDMKILFAQKMDNELIGTLTGATKALETGQADKFASIVRAVPKEYRKDFIATGIVSTFGNVKNDAVKITNFIKWYDGIKKNQKAMATMLGSLDEADRAALKNGLEDTYKVFSTYNNAANQVVNTGLMGSIEKALEAVMQPQGIVGRIMLYSMQGAYQVFSGALQARFGVGGSVANSIMRGITGMRQSVLSKADDLIADPAFTKLAFEQASGTVKQETIKQVARSSRFRKYASAVMDRPMTDATELERFLMSMLPVRGVTFGQERPGGRKQQPSMQ